MGFPVELYGPEGCNGAGTFDPAGTPLSLNNQAWYIANWSTWIRQLGFAVKGANIEVGEAGSIGTPWVPAETVMEPLDLFVCGDVDPTGATFDADPFENARIGYDTNMAVLTAAFAPIETGNGGITLAVTGLAGQTVTGLVQPQRLTLEEEGVGWVRGGGYYSKMGHYKATLIVPAGEVTIT